jgi:hypothetical protein
MPVFKGHLLRYLAVVCIRTSAYGAGDLVIVCCSAV